MSARDELAEVIETAYDLNEGMVTFELLAHAILAAGYSKPRTITTVEELEALPEDTAIVDQCERLTLEETSMECLEWVDRHGNACAVMLPATVLHTPKES